jgi:ribonuclease HII
LFRYNTSVTKFLIGVDEAGRGPLAGPVAVGAVRVPRDFDFSLLKDVRDSKQISQLGREIWFEKIQTLKSEGLTWSVAFSSVTIIDQYGITRAVRRAVHRAVRALAPEPQGVEILLDGLLTAPQDYKQETIIGGDESEPLIALASIAAKVRRDRLMRRLALRFPEYGFDIHKGYATKAHRKALTTLGLCEIHRTTYCEGLIK